MERLVENGPRMGRGGESRRRERGRGNGVMKSSIIVLVVVVAVLVGGFAFLSAWNIPSPAKQVEKVISNEKLSR